MRCCFIILKFFIFIFIFFGCFMKLCKIQVKCNWYLIDASGLTLGRLASSISSILKGKHSVHYTASMDYGDYVIVVNSDKIVITGNKFKDKLYYRHSGYPGGLRAIPFCKMFEKYSDRIIRIAVKGMLPKNPLGRKMFLKLKVYKANEHPHISQKPLILKV